MWLKQSHIGQKGLSNATIVKDFRIPLKIAISSPAAISVLKITIIPTVPFKKMNETKLIA